MRREPAPRPASSGIPGLDDVLVEGFPPGHIYLIQGDPGVGKTTLGLQFLMAGAKEGGRPLYVTLSETADDLREGAASHGWDISGIEIYEVTPAAELAIGENNTLFHPSEVELGETIRGLLQEVERIDPSRIVIDSLAEVRLLSQTPLRYRRQILALKQLFSQRSSTVLFLDDRSEDPGDMHVESIAHGILQLDQLAPLYGAERRRIRIKKLRGVGFRGGYHDMCIRTGGLDVYPRLVASEHGQEILGERIASGVVNLDSLTGGGLDRGTTTLIMGPAGTGKSAIAAVYASAVASGGENAALFIFEEGLATLMQRTEALGIPLRQLIEEGRIGVQTVDPAEVTPGEFAHRIRDSVERDGARLVVIDSLSGYYNAMPEETFLTLHLHELFSYLRQKGVAVVTTLAQHGFAGELASPIDLSFLADTVLLLRFFETGGELRKAISVPKKRSGAHESAIREFALDRRGLHVGEPLRGFHGILNGDPTFVGDSAELMKEGSSRGRA
ncbi:MAG TPA: ATPase domain-containing protein [Thermoanaerobaculia bacterium]|jgi:circadian clock protein KaiC